MRTRLRIGAAVSVALGALLLASVLASPALAWHSNVTVNARCLDGKVRVHYTVEAWEKGHQAKLHVFYQIGLADRVVVEDDTPLYNTFTGHFDLPNDRSGEITVTAVITWKNGDKVETSSDSGSDKLPPPGKCEKSTTTTTVAGSTTTTTLQETTTTLGATTTTETEVAPSSSLATTTTQTAVGAATSTTGGGALPFTGASSGPMLLAGLVLVGGGALVLFVSRNRSQTR